MKIKKQSVYKVFISFFLITLGATAAAFAIELFLLPSKILDGGVVGVSMILYHMTGISLSIFTLLLNAPFVLIGLRNIGKGFFIRAIYAMIVFALMIQVFTAFSPVTDDPLLAVVFGGVLLGIGVGTVLRNGGCLDGTETVALLLSKKTSFSVGQIIFGINIFIYAAAGLLFGWDRAMYSLLTYFITFKIIDMVEVGMEQAKSVTIICDQGGEIAEKIFQVLGRTCTIMDGKGLISGSKDILYCVITRVELSEMRKIVKDTDQSAFVTISDVSEIVGSHIKSTAR